MIVDTITEAKANLSALIEKVQAGESVIINKAGKPVAVLLSYRDYRKERRPGAYKGRIRIEKDFDELPADIAAAFGLEAAEKP